MRVLITGGTVFVSRYVAEWFVRRGDEVYVLNRGTRPQSPGVKLIRADRHALTGELKGIAFDTVIDVCAYTGADVNTLLDALGEYHAYVLISSSAVYPETNTQPFSEDQCIGYNAVWGKYGTDKMDAERMLLSRTENAWVLRPPYLYGPMNNVYREGFVFDCAMQGRTFVLPRDGSMFLQFFHVEDLCRVIERVLEVRPEEHILNVGNPETVSVKEFVALCYEIAGSSLQCTEEHTGIPQRQYFCFHDYAYRLDVTRQRALIDKTVPLKQGLQESFAWYMAHPDAVRKRDYMGFIDQYILV